MFWDILLDSLLDVLKVLPFILAIYLLIEWIETSATNTKRVNGLLQKPYAPAISALLGIVPQCGFSCVATNLYNKKYIAMGTLLAVYISTSDEALPILLGSAINDVSSLDLLWKIILVKLAYALIVGFAVNFVLSLAGKRKNAVADNDKQISDQKDSRIAQDEHNEENHREDGACVHNDNTVGCCHHELSKKPNFWEFIVHPLLHSAKILLYIFVVNVILGVVIDIWIGEENLAVFMQQALFAQPFVIALVGLIPNCAASVIITELLLDGAISFGGALAGLCCNAGIGLALLFSNKSNVKNNFALLGILYFSSCLLGVILSFFA